jgi:hypothetical protein
MKNIYVAFVILTIALVISGCNDKLSRGEAKLAIIKAENLPLAETKGIQLSVMEEPFAFLHDSFKDGTQLEKEQSRIPAKNTLLSELQDRGLITYTVDIEVIKNEEVWSRPDPRYGEVYNVTKYPGYDKKRLVTKERYVHRGVLTEKGKQYEKSPGRFVVSTLDFGEVTGIVEGPNTSTAQVSYTTKRGMITPFGVALGIQEYTDNKTAHFTKYDDGWRINQR